MQILTDNIRLLDSLDQHRMPWKNGGGVTHELAIFPEDAALDGQPFLWRISIAEVSADGPFSLFPGYDRSIMLIEGEGMELTGEGSDPVTVSSPYEPVRFSGDTRTACRLLNGPVRDFNVMSARGKVNHHCDMIRQNAAEAVWQYRTTALFCHCLQGNVIVKMPDHAELRIQNGESLLFPVTATGGATRILLVPHSIDTIAVLVTLKSADS